MATGETTAEFLRTLALRDDYPAAAMYAIACCRARIGDRDPALEAILAVRERLPGW